MDRGLRGLRLAVLASIAWPAPPTGYGPWEQIAFDIADGMRRRGLDVTLFATGNSQFAGNIASVIPVGLNEDPALNGDVFGALHVGELFRARARIRPDPQQLRLEAADLRACDDGAAAADDHTRLFVAADPCGVLRVRVAQFLLLDLRRRPRSRPRLPRTTYNGVDPDEFPFDEQAGDYLVFLGRFHPEKGTHLAIEIAKRAGVRLKMAAIPHDEALLSRRR